jgi:anti-sigma factor RsiW
MLLGAYVLGGLPADEAAAVRVHLDGCAQCRAEHDELACVPSWLDLVPGRPNSRSRQRGIEPRPQIRRSNECEGDRERVRRPAPG